MLVYAMLAYIIVGIVFTTWFYCRQFIETPKLTLLDIVLFPILCMIYPSIILVFIMFKLEDVIIVSR
jgi:hypothetical protein